MNLYLRPDKKLAQYDKYVSVLNVSLYEIASGVGRDFITMSRTERGTMFTYGIRTVEFYQRPDDDHFWLQLKRGTKGSIDSHYDNSDEDFVDAVNVTLNWLVHQEYSSDNHIELTERLAREAAKYA